VIETASGELIAERRDPAASFAGLAGPSRWDELQAACFASEAGWSCFTAPFLFAREDFAAEETWPWREDGEVWRALLVTYPGPVAAQHRQQTCYFDRAGLLRRLDCEAGGPGGAVHYPSCYREFGGIMVPTRRRVYPRGPDGL